MGKGRERRKKNKRKAERMRQSKHNMVKCDCGEVIPESVYREHCVKCPKNSSSV